MRFILQADGSELAEDADIVVPWWSFTKTLIAALALTLVRDGILGLDDPLGGEAYTLRDLLQHRAGLADYGLLPSYHAAVAADHDAWAVEQLLGAVAPLHGRMQRGDFAYSNVGYLLVRRHIERVTGASLGEALRDRLFGPLGINGRYIAEQRNDLSHVQTGSVASYDPRWVYHGLAVGTLRDAALLLHRLITSDLLPAQLRADMCSGVPVGDVGADRPWRMAAYGLGVMTGVTNDGLRVVGHTGGGPGSGVAMYRFSESGMTVAVFTDGEQMGEAEREVFALGQRH